MTELTVKNNKIKIWALIISFILPVAGIIFYFVFRKTNKLTANTSLLVSIISLIIILLIKP